ncbi:MAG: hypothetical protein ACYYKD_04920 [Rhodospirillales bacterium]
MLDWLKKKRADTGPRARFSAAGFAAVIGLVCGLAAATGVARAADDARAAYEPPPVYGPPVSRTPLADTGLWEPPILNSTGDIQYLDIPEDEGLAAFYGNYKSVSANELVLFDHISLNELDVHYFGNDHRPVRDHIVQYKVLHQAKNYLLVKYREFPYKNTLSAAGNPFYDHGRAYTKAIGFGIIVFEKKRPLDAENTDFYFSFTFCDPSWLPLFAPDTYHQPPERDIEDLKNTWSDKEMRKHFPKGEVACYDDSRGYFSLMRLRRN